jgi:membrane-associated phospholipid phosphatase
MAESQTRALPRPAHLAFGGFLAVITVWLLAAHELAYAAGYGALLALLAALTSARRCAPSGCAATLENAYFPVTMNVAFTLMRGAVPALRAQRYDHRLLALDLRLFGGSANVWLERFARPALTELLSACYLLFFPLLLVSCVRYFFWHKERLEGFFAGLFTVYGVGFLGYLLVPAAGPYLAFPELFDVPLLGGPITRLNQTLVAAGSNRVDVFPSLHCAVSTYILAYSFRHQRREFWLLLLPIAGLCVATLYLRYHYLVDVLSGFLLAGLGLCIARRPAVSIQGCLS